LTAANSFRLFSSGRLSPVLPACGFSPKPVACPSLDEILKARKSKLNPGLVTYYRKPVYITQVGQKKYLSLS
jgi:hypothetical protein